jgi:uncharacterized RDD family membrane protein YckC
MEQDGQITVGGFTETGANVPPAPADRWPDMAPTAPDLPPPGTDAPPEASPSGSVTSPEETTPQPLQPAGFLRRALAFAIDLVVMQFLYFILYVVGVLGASRSTEWEHIAGVIASPALAMPFIAAWFFLFVGYFSFFHAYGGQTPAKMLIRIKVVTREGQPLSHVQSICRTLAYALSSFFFGFGFLLSIIERKKRGLHDLLTRSHVVLA